MKDIKKRPIAGTIDQIEIIYLNSTKNKNINYRNYNVFGFPFTL